MNRIGLANKASRANSLVNKVASSSNPVKKAKACSRASKVNRANKASKDSRASKAHRAVSSPVSSRAANKASPASSPSRWVGRAAPIPTNNLIHSWASRPRFIVA